MVDIQELAKQAPYLFAIITIVWAFLNAQAKRDDIFLKAQEARDKLFLSAISENNQVVAGLSKEVERGTEILIMHDTKMTEVARGLEGQKRVSRKAS